jgi:hypothetical protein
VKGIKRMIALVLFVTPGLVGADLQLKPIHPQESVAETLNRRFSLDNALANIGSIQGWLDSFRRLTKAAKGKITAAAWKEIGSTEWDTQTLGFANLPLAVTGTLRYQNYRLKQALLQLTMAEERAGRGSPPGTEQARLEFAQAEREFQQFWDSLSVAD